MSRTLTSLLAVLALLAFAPVNAQTVTQVASLRQHNTQFMAGRHQERAVFARSGRMPETKSSRQAVIRMVQQEGFTAVFVDVSSLVTDERTAERDYAWRSFLGEMHRLGVSVYGMVGDSGLTDDSGLLYDAIDAIARYQAIGQPGQTFDGLLILQPTLSSSLSHRSMSAVNSDSMA